MPQMSDSEEDLPPGIFLHESLSERLKKHGIQRSRRKPEDSGAAEARSRPAAGALERLRCPMQDQTTFIFFDPAAAHASRCPRAPRGGAPFSRSNEPFGTILGIPDIYVAHSKRCDHCPVAPVPSWLIIDLVLLHTIWHVQAEHPTPCTITASAWFSPAHSACHCACRACHGDVRTAWVCSEPIRESRTVACAV